MKTTLTMARVRSLETIGWRTCRVRLLPFAHARCDPFHKPNFSCLLLKKMVSTKSLPKLESTLAVDRVGLAIRFQPAFNPKPQTQSPETLNTFAFWYILIVVAAAVFNFNTRHTFRLRGLGLFGF